MPKRALISVSDKTGIVPFAQKLIQLDFEIISTGGTYALLQKEGIPVIPIDALTGFPEMLDGRVKTLHPKIHGGLLALRNNPAHMATCKQHGIDMIDLVVVNLYPFEQTISNANVAFAQAIEQIDIGGPSMLRSAAKNFESVGVVVNPNDYELVLNELQTHGALLPETLKKLALTVFQHTSRYDSLIANYIAQQIQAPTLPQTLPLGLEKITDLRYGENPHQEAAFYRLSFPQGLASLVQLHGKELSYNNLIDLEAAWQLTKTCEFPAATIIKHTNPCGFAMSSTLSEAYNMAFSGDPTSAFGGIVGLNRRVDLDTAIALSQTFIEAIIAPQYADDALELLKQKPSIRLISLPHFFHQSPFPTFRYVEGGFLVQTPDTLRVTREMLNVVTQKCPSDAEFKDLVLSFAVVKQVKSNAIVVLKNGQVVGVGAGQMSRIEATEIALKKAGEKAKGAVLASDAFFPFSDCVQLCAKAGISAIIQPGGSKRDEESIIACNQADISMVMTGIRHFKH